MLDCVTVMAGGVGSRLWPASHEGCPKQFLPLGDEGESLLERTLNRALALNPGVILVVAPSVQLALLRGLARRFPAEVTERVHLLLEPEGRNTAPALMLASKWLQQRGLVEGSQLVLAADHLIRPLESFAAAVDRAVELSARFLVVFGIPPTYPETGYGYVEKGDACDRGFLVRRFIEKPDEHRARQLVQSGRYFWNSGMFCYSTSLFLEQTRQHCPELLTPFERVMLPQGDGKSPPVYRPSDEVFTAYRALPKLSIDYALMERSDRVAMVAAEFDWSDVGSWDAMAEIDQDGRLSVAHRGTVCQLEASNNYVRTQQPVALCGVRDLIVVEANGRLLICRRGASQLVKSVRFPGGNGGFR